MRLPNYRFADYRLAAYVVVGAVVAGGVVFMLDQAFAPTQKVQANGAPVAAVNADGVRQIPIAKTSTEDLGDPQGKLSPVYPVAPGKNLEVKEAPVVQAKPVPAAAAAPAAAVAAAPAVPATSGTAVATAPVAAAPAVGAVCKVEECAAAYRSFRESDCSYQPFGGPRRYCEGAPDANAPANGGQVAQQPQQQQYSTPAPRGTQFDPRSVRRLPAPGQSADDNDDDDGRVDMEPPAQRYDLRRNWVVEPQE